MTGKQPANLQSQMHTDHKMRHPLFRRATEIARLRRRLEWDGYPRLQMTLIVALTGGSGFLASFALLHAGPTEMWLRYLCAFGLAYLMFLLLLWLWMRTSASDYADIGDLANLVPSPSSSGTPAPHGSFHPPFSGQGGTADGGGASANFDLTDSEIPLTPSSSGIASPGDALSAAVDSDELALPLIVLVMLGALLLSSFWIVYSAPLLFAELLLDGLLAAGLYRRLRGIESEHWILTAIKRTFWAFLLTALLFAAAGWLMQKAIPEAHSMGEFIQRHAQVD